MPVVVPGNSVDWWGVVPAYGTALGRASTKSLDPSLPPCSQGTFYLFIGFFTIWPANRDDFGLVFCFIHFQFYPSSSLGRMVISLKELAAPILTEVSGLKEVRILTHLLVIWSWPHPTTTYSLPPHSLALIPLTTRRNSGSKPWGSAPLMPCPFFLPTCHLMWEWGLRQEAVW